MFWVAVLEVYGDYVPDKADDVADDEDANG